MHKCKIDYEYAIKAYQNGESCRDIAKRFNVDQSSVATGLRLRGVLLRKRTGVYHKIDKNELEELYITKKLPMTDVAKALGVCQSTIKFALVENNIPIRNHSDSTKASFDNGKRRRVYKRQIQNGYIELTIPDYPHARDYGRVFEHTVVWERAHGVIPKGWIVHHINGIKDDNRLENLVALSKRDHANILRIQKKRIVELEQQIKLLKSQLELD